MEEKIESILYAWTVDWDNMYTEKWKKRRMEETFLVFFFFFFIRMNSEMVILLNTNILTYYL